MKFKRILLIAFCLALTLCSVLAFSSCGDDECEHEWGETTVSIAPTCETKGQGSHTCSKCETTESVELDAVAHNYVAGGWSWDATIENAYLSFVCSFNSQHTTTVTATLSATQKDAPTCTVAGTETVLATVELNGTTYTDTKERAVSPTGIHTYVDGKCSVCQNPCPHESTTEKTLDLSTHGGCKSVIKYTECVCGKTTIDKDNFAYLCDFGELIDEKSGTVTCKDCGVTMQCTTLGDDTTLAESCETSNQTVFTFSKGETVILKNAELSSGYTNHYTESTVLDLREYSSCGSFFEVGICNKCDKAVALYDYEIFCDGGVTPTSSSIEINGVAHNIITIDCDDENCSLIIKIDEWTEKDGCAECEYVNIQIYNGTTLLYEPESYEEISEHDISDDDATFFLKGDTCEDGVMGIVECKDCGYTETYMSTSCPDYDYIEETMDLSSYQGLCAGTTVKAKKCMACDTVLSAQLTSSNCSFSNTETSSYTDEDGISHQVMQRACTVCELSRKLDGYSLTEGCTTISYQHNEFLYGTALVASYDYYDEETDHSWGEYEYELLGESCEDGVMLTRTCSKCSDESSYTQFHHELVKTERYDSSDYGLTYYFYLEIQECACGEVVSFDYDIDSLWEYEDETYETDDNNILHYISTYTVAEEGISLIIDSYTIAENACTDLNYVEISLTIDDEPILTKRKLPSGVENECGDSPSNRSIKLVGERCENSYIVTDWCDDCGYFDMYRNDEHTEYTVMDYFYDCANQHFFKVKVCPCGLKSSYGGSFLNENTTQTGKELYCYNCNFKVKITESTETNGCNAIVTSVYTLFNGEEELDSITVKSPITVHDITSNIEYNDTVIFTQDCKNCDYSVTQTFYNAVLTKPEGEDEYYYNFNFTPTESGVYTITGLSDSDTYVELFLDGKRLDYNDDGSWDSDFQLSYELEAGKSYTYKIRFYSRNEGIIPFIFLNGEPSSCSHDNNSDEYYLLKKGSSSCEDGAIHVYVCSDCSLIFDSEKITSHEELKITTYSLDEHGACYGLIATSSCICGEKTSYSMHYYCATQVESENVTVNGIEGTKKTISCETCQLVITETTYNKTEGCYTYRHSILSVKVGDTTVIEEFSSKELIMTTHSYNVSYNLCGESCEDGYDKTSTCITCGYSYTEEELTNHEMVTKFLLSEQELDGICDFHSFEYRECPCSGTYTLYTDLTSEVACEECKLLLIHTTSASTPENCVKTVTETIALSLDGTPLFSDSVSYSATAHSYALSSASEDSDGNITCSVACSACTQKATDAIYKISISADSCYTFTFTPTVSGIYTIYGISSKDTCVDLYDEEHEWLALNDNGNIDADFALTYELEAGVSYTYEISFFGADTEGDIYFAMMKGVPCEDCDGEELVSTNVLKNGSTTANDGALTVKLCPSCGIIHEISDYVASEE